MPFKSKKQRTYLAINEPDVYKKFKKEETMTKKIYPSAGPSKKERKKFQKESDKRKRKKAAIKMGNLDAAAERNRMIQEQARAPFKGKDRQDFLFGKGLKRTEAQRKMNKYNRDKIMSRPMGGKVYKVDNSGQQMVAKQYGGKVK